MEITVAISDYAFALCVLIATLVVPFAGLYQLLRLKRRAIEASTRSAHRLSQP